MASTDEEKEKRAWESAAAGNGVVLHGVDPNDIRGMEAEPLLQQKLLMGETLKVAEGVGYFPPPASR